MKREERRLLSAASALALLCALLALFVASTSSPRYETNFWTDTNLYFTIGRGMREGLMPYRDLFDHKGPLLFLIYGLAACISDTSFLGVYLLEAVSLFCMLLAAWRLISLFGEGELTLCAIPLTAMVTVACTAFNQGGCAEEFCLPALTIAVTAAMGRFMRGGQREGSALRLAAFGAAMAWVFAIKYTDCGLFFGVGLFWLLEEWRVSGFGCAVVSGLWMLAGFAALLLPVCAFLLANGILGDCIEVYFVQNLFSYSGEPMTLAGHVLNALAYLRTQSAINPAVALLAALGCAFAALWLLARREKGCVLAALAMPAGAGLLLLTCYWGEMAHPYYALVFAALAPLGLCPLAWALGRLRGLRWRVPALVLTAAVVPVSLSLCAAAPLAQVRREDMPQTEFAAIMAQEPGATLLDLSSLDQGFYLAAGITPVCRYFADNNLETQEKREAIDGYLAQGLTDYVVTSWRDPGARYALIAERDGVFDLNADRHYRLYRRIEEEP